MRLYGRITNKDSSRAWVTATTDANGNNDLVYVTALIQVLQLVLGESLFYAWAGIPTEDSLVAQVYPDYYVSLIQQVYALYFASLLITRRPATFSDPTPIYDANVITHQGVRLSASAPIPT